MKGLIGLRIARDYCQGYFKDEYNLRDAVVEAVGRDWVVLRLRDGSPDYQWFRDWKRKDIKRTIREWSTPEEE